ncbi:MAG: polyketide cyclase [Leptolyngbya sp. SIO3F4]|nr:polyketide cyclase [Leptolyngbya sp. SIO3F4]
MQRTILAFITVLLFSGTAYAWPPVDTFSATTPKNQTTVDTIQINFDSLKKDHWSAQDIQHVTLLIDFIQHLMNDHDFGYVEKQFGNNLYTQHNRNIPDGLTALIENVRGLAKRYPEYTYDVKHIYVDGDYVIFHSHATLKAKHRGNDQKGLNIIDTWRIENGLIAEHWDAIQPLDASMRFFVWMNGGKIRNTNGVF